MQGYLPPSTQCWKGRDDGAGLERVHQRVQCLDWEALAKQAIPSSAAALIGFACDEGVKRNQGRLGAAQGPSAIRQALANLCLHQAPQTHLYDLGDICCEEGQLETAQAALAQGVNQALKAGLLPMVLGGGHETAWGHFCGLLPRLKKSNFAIINLDAHFDLRPLLPDSKGSSGTPFLQIAKLCEQENLNFNYTCLGLQAAANTPSLYATANSLGVHYLHADTLHDEGLEPAYKLLDQVLAKVDSIYLSVCLDVFAAAIAPGVSAPQANGLTLRQGVALIHKIISSRKLLAFDIVELSPPWDLGGQTARLAAWLLWQSFSFFAANQSLS